MQRASGSAFRVLVADDSAAHKLFARCVFQSLGCEVTLARDGYEAVKLALVQAFDLILMDRYMPRMDGDAATRMIRRSSGPSSGATIVAHVSSAREVEASLYDRVVAKPVTTYEIADLVPEQATRRAVEIDVAELREARTGGVDVTRRARAPAQRAA